METILPKLLPPCCAASACVKPSLIVDKACPRGIEAWSAINIDHAINSRFDLPPIIGEVWRHCAQLQELIDVRRTSLQLLQFLIHVVVSTRVVAIKHKLVNLGLEAAQFLYQLRIGWSA